jgi:hypothetical protein
MRSYAHGVDLVQAYSNLPDHITVHNVFKRQGVLRPRGLQPDELLGAIRLYEDGWSLGRLATELDVSPSTVNRALRQAGVHVRRPGPPRGHSAS